MRHGFTIRLCRMRARFRCFNQFQGRRVRPFSLLCVACLPAGSLEGIPDRAMAFLTLSGGILTYKYIGRALCMALFAPYGLLCLCGVFLYARHASRPFFAVFMALCGLFWRALLWSFGGFFASLVFCIPAELPRALCRQNRFIWRFMALHVHIYVRGRFALPMAFFRAYGVRWYPAYCQYFGAVPRIAAGNIM